MKKLSHGLTLVELIVAIAIIGVLMSLGAPAYSNWVSNVKVRTLAESMQSALNLARAEAVRRNMRVSFRLVSTVDNTCGAQATFSVSQPVNWIVSLDDPIANCGGGLLDDRFPVTDDSNNPAPRIILRRASTEGVSGVAVSAGASAFIFDGMGRLVSAPSQIEVSNPARGDCVHEGTNGEVRCLRVVVTAGGQVRMCDPAYSVGDTQGC